MKLEHINEAIGEIEDGMSHIATTQDIWQHRLIYALCFAVRLMLLDKLKERRKG